MSSQSSQNQTTDSAWDTVDSEKYDLPKRSLQDCAQIFYEQLRQVGDEIEALKDTYDSILSLASRLVVLHPNSIETPTLALDLRSSLQQAASTLKAVDSNLYELWDCEERVRIACDRDKFSIDGLQGIALSIEVARRRSAVEALVRRFKRRCRDIKNESRWEKDERRDVAEERREPLGVDDYLARGSDCPNLTRNDVVHASRWLVSNPFTVLSKLLDNLQVLHIPAMIADDQTPATFLAPAPRHVRRSTRHSVDLFESSPLLSADPTPVGNADRTRVLSSWKSEILLGRPSKPTPLHKAFDRVSDTVHDWSIQSASSDRAKKEKWIVLSSLMLLPLVLVAILVEKLIDSGSTAASSSAWRPSAATQSLTSLFPTMINQNHSQGRSMDTSVAVSESTALRRRRDSFRHHEYV